MINERNEMNRNGVFKIFPGFLPCKHPAQYLRVLEGYLFISRERATQHGRIGTYGTCVGEILCSPSIPDPCFVK
jgi:hypothetical protein